MAQQVSLCSRHRLLVILLFCITTLTSSLRHDKIMSFVSADDSQLQIDLPYDRSADIINEPNKLPANGAADTAGFQQTPTSPADDDGLDEGILSGLRRLKRRRRSVDDRSDAESKRYSSFRSDLGKRIQAVDEMATDNDYTENDKRARSAAFRSDLGKRRAFRSDLGKRSESEEEELFEEPKRYSSFRSDLGKRFPADDDVKRYSAFRSDLGKRISAVENAELAAADADFESGRFSDNAADKRAAFRSDLGKRRAFRSDLGKRIVTKKLAFRSDLGKRPVAFRSDLGKR